LIWDLQGILILPHINEILFVLLLEYFPLLEERGDECNWLPFGFLFIYLNYLKMKKTLNFFNEVGLKQLKE